MSIHESSETVQDALVSYKALVIHKNQIISTLNVDAKNEFEAWSLACTTYLNDHIQADQANVDIRITAMN